MVKVLYVWKHSYDKEKCVLGVTYLITIEFREGHGIDALKS